MDDQCGHSKAKGREFYLVCGGRAIFSLVQCSMSLKRTILEQVVELRKWVDHLKDGDQHERRPCVIASAKGKIIKRYKHEDERHHSIWSS